MVQLWTSIFTLTLAVGGAAAWYWGGNWCIERALPSRAALLRPWLFLGPAALAIGLYLIYPLAATLWISFHDRAGVGLANYHWLFADPGFRAAVWNNLMWILVVPAAATALGLLAAVLSARIWWGSFARLLIFLPMAISFVGAAVIWKFIYDYAGAGPEQIGLLNALVLAFGGVPRAWMTLPFWNSLCLMIILIWIQTGFAMVVLGAALRRVPDDLREAAMLDGASAVQALFRIILPQIWGTIGAVWIVISIITFKVFDIVLAMTNGQWNTNVLANLMFNWMFQGGGDFGRGAAIAVVLMGMIMPVMLWVMHKIWRAEGQGR